MASTETQQPTTEERWLDYIEIAEYLNFKPSTVKKKVRLRQIPFHRIPGTNRVRFRRSEIDTWMESGRVETVDEYLARQG